jgi:hypothetical protein
MQSHLGGYVATWAQTMLLGLKFTGSAYRAPDGQVVWIDPPDPGEEEMDLLALGKPAHILVTFRDHDRHVAALAARYDAQVWIPKGKGGEIATVHHEFDEQSTLPAGLRALDMSGAGYGEHALLAEAHGKRFAFIGDALFNFDDSHFPSLVRWLFFKHGSGPLWLKRHYRGGDASLVPGQLARLADFKPEALFLSHGPAVTQHAEELLRGCLED